MPTVERATEQRWTVAQAVQRSRVHWARVVLAVLLCVAMWHTNAVPVYRAPSTADATTLAVPEDVTPVQSVQPPVQPAGTVAPPPSDDDDNNYVDDDDDDEFEGLAKQQPVSPLNDAAQQEQEQQEQQPTGTPQVSLLFVLLFSLFEPFPQLALLTLTRSGASCALAVVASLVQPEVAALYFAAVRGHAQHHPLLFAALALVVAADTLFGNLYNALAVALRLVLPRARWAALVRYCAEVQGDIDRTRARAKRD